MVHTGPVCGYPQLDLPLLIRTYVGLRRRQPNGRGWRIFLDSTILRATTAPLAIAWDR
jgi:hypothetical protein